MAAVQIDSTLNKIVVGETMADLFSTSISLHGISGLSVY